MKILAAQINPTIGDIPGNTRKIIAVLKRGKEKGADIVLLTELAVSGYFPDDLLLDPSFIEACEKSLEEIAKATKGLFAIVGLPRKNPEGKEKPLFNSAAIFQDGKLLGFKDKTLLPTYDVFDERRYFEPGEAVSLWDYKGLKVAVTICEDLWQGRDVGYTKYRINPIEELREKRPDLVVNLSGSPYSFGRLETRASVFQRAAIQMKCPVILCNQAGANDQLVFDGHSLFFDKQGKLLQIAKGFVEEDLLIDLQQSPPPIELKDAKIQDLYEALVTGVRDYLHKQGFKKAMLGLSGGIDSAVTACIAVEALGADNVLALSLPSRFSSEGSKRDAQRLSSNLKIALKQVEIDGVFQSYLDLLEPYFQGRAMDVTEENIQSRIRGATLMAFSNKFGYLLLNTGNKSEMAMGYTTLYGDMAGGLGVLHDVVKTRVYKLAAYINRRHPLIPQEIIDKVPSAELRENQTDFDTLPRFEILDPIIEDYIEEGTQPSEIAVKRKFDLSLVKKIVSHIHAAEYKRRQTPISIRVTQKSFNKGRIIPIVQKWII
jgi:NAD+ synthase (glutamine-hydrolysing)